MSAPKSQSPAETFGTRVREIRERRGLSQSELARRLDIDRTSLNKIEAKTRGDVSISQLFHFAEVLRVGPANLLTPRLDGLGVALTPGGPVLAPREAREWIRRGPPPPTNQEEFQEWFLDLPRDEQQLLLEQSMTAGLSPLQANLVADTTAERVGKWMAHVDRLIDEQQERGAEPRKSRRRHTKKGDDDG